MKKNNDSTTKDNVTVTSFKYQPKRWNDKDFEDFEKLTHFSYNEDDIQSPFGME